MVLPASDMFTEDLRLIINNCMLYYIFISYIDSSGNAFNKKAEIRLYNTDNIEVAISVISGEYIILATAN